MSLAHTAPFTHLQNITIQSIPIQNTTATQDRIQREKQTQRKLNGTEGEKEKRKSQARHWGRAKEGEDALLGALGGGLVVSTGRQRAREAVMSARSKLRVENNNKVPKIQ